MVLFLFFIGILSRYVPNKTDREYLILRYYETEDCSLSVAKQSEFYPRTCYSTNDPHYPWMVIANATYFSIDCTDMFSKTRANVKFCNKRAIVAWDCDECFKMYNGGHDRYCINLPPPMGSMRVQCPYTYEILIIVGSVVGGILLILCSIICGIFLLILCCFLCACTGKVFYGNLTPKTEYEDYSVNQANDEVPDKVFE